MGFNSGFKGLTECQGLEYGKQGHIVQTDLPDYIKIIAKWIGKIELCTKQNSSLIYIWASL